MQEKVCRPAEEHPFFLLLFWGKFNMFHHTISLYWSSVIYLILKYFTLSYWKITLKDRYLSVFPQTSQDGFMLNVISLCFDW